MGRAVRLGLALCLAFLAGCSQEPEPLPVACLEGEGPYLRALRAAPADVRLPGGTPISECTRLGTSQADAQNVGILLLRAADELHADLPASEEAALRLGYLVGATRRGAERTNGLQIELARRMEQVVGIGGPPPQRAPAYREGMRAGLARG